MTSRRYAGIGGAFALSTLLSWASHEPGYGRRFWYPLVVTALGARSHEQVVTSLRPKHLESWKERARTSGVAFPPSRVRLVGLKEEKLLEVWARRNRGWTRLRTYPILAASGGPGPKLREGDQQVPEGLYRLTGFNPNSSYHLSIRVDYPSAEDRAIAQREGRTSPGSDIYIHGKAVSIGCLAIGDEAIEELYLLLAETGLRNSDVVLAPSLRPAAATAPPWLPARYRSIQAALKETRGQ